MLQPYGLLPPNTPGPMKNAELVDPFSSLTCSARRKCCALRHEVATGTVNSGPEKPIECPPTTSCVGNCTCKLVAVFVSTSFVSLAGTPPFMIRAHPLDSLAPTTPTTSLGKISRSPLQPMLSIDPFFQMWVWSKASCGGAVDAMRSYNKAKELSLATLAFLSSMRRAWGYAASRADSIVWRIQMVRNSHS